MSVLYCYCLFGEDWTESLRTSADPPEILSITLESIKELPNISQESIIYYWYPNILFKLFTPTPTPLSHPLVPIL